MRVFEWISARPNVKVVLVNIFAGITDLAEPENQFEDSATRLLEVYVPVRTPGGTDLLFEAYFRYNGVAEAGRRVWERFAPVMFGALIVVTLLHELARRKGRYGLATLCVSGGQGMAVLFERL